MLVSHCSVSLSKQILTKIDFSTFYFINFHKSSKRQVEIIAFSILYMKIVIKELKSLNQVQVKNRV